MVQEPSAKLAVGRVRCGNKQGTAFLISPNLVVTASHAILRAQSGHEVEIHFLNVETPLKRTATLLAEDRVQDVALLRLEEPATGIPYLHLAYQALKVDTPWESYGYPSFRDDEGLRLTGLIHDIKKPNHPNKYDVELSCRQYKQTLEMGGASGAPLIVDGLVQGMITHKISGLQLGANSMASMSAFFESQGVSIEKAPQYREEEVAFLRLMIEQGRIGFEAEDMPYQVTYAAWRSLSQYGREDEEGRAEESEAYLRPIEELIEEYFPAAAKSYRGQILFGIADFGKGKSAFLKHVAAGYATAYLAGNSKVFPVYLNLRDYREMHGTTGLGYIGDFLLYEYGINLTEDDYKCKSYIFLIDSLDEVADVHTTEGYARVVESIERIAAMKPAAANTNKVLITSRPLQAIVPLIKKYKPKIDREKKPMFLSLYGFKESQFNEYLGEVLPRWSALSEAERAGYQPFHRQILKHAEAGALARFLLEEEVLDRSQLRRPIFAYMIYKLVVSNEEFFQDKKVSIYLSFLNLLTKEAKHRDDDAVQHQLSVRNELQHRNLLHATAALWLYNRQRKYELLDHRELQRVVSANGSIETVDEVGVHRFLTHSYLGQQGNRFYFKHQSFVEMWLAEYLVKAFLFQLFEEEMDAVEAAVRLMLGVPTDQTMEFVKGLLELVKDSTGQDAKAGRARRQLFPLVSSMGLPREAYNPNFASEAIAKWMERIGVDEHAADIPDDLSDWPIGDAELKRMVELAGGDYRQSRGVLGVAGGVEDLAL